MGAFDIPSNVSYPFPAVPEGLIRSGSSEQKSASLSLRIPAQNSRLVLVGVAGTGNDSVIGVRRGKEAFGELHVNVLEDSWQTK